MNWLGKLVQKEVGKKDTVLDLGCGIMQSTLDTCPTYPKTRLKCSHIVGVDIYPRYLDVLKNKKGISVICANVLDAIDLFQSDSFDIVLLLDIIEHFEQSQVMVLIGAAEYIARKKVIIYTPSYWYDNSAHCKEHFPYTGLGDNEYQVHKCFIEPWRLTDRGYKVSFPSPDKNTYAIKLM